MQERKLRKLAVFLLVWQEKHCFRESTMAAKASTKCYIQDWPLSLRTMQKLASIS